MKGLHLSILTGKISAHFKGFDPISGLLYWILGWYILLAELEPILELWKFEKL